MPRKDYEARKQYYRDYYAKNRKKILAHHAQPVQNARRKHVGRERYHQLNYGMSKEEAETLRNTRTGCDICGGTAGGPHGKFVIDHNHTTGQIRGVICNACNQAIGKLRDDPAVILKAAEYLSYYEEVAHGSKI